MLALCAALLAAAVAVAVAAAPASAKRYGSLMRGKPNANYGCVDGYSMTGIDLMFQWYFKRR
jgi:hypothetical protein